MSAPTPRIRPVVVCAALPAAVFLWLAFGNGRVGAQSGAKYDRFDHLSGEAATGQIREIGGEFRSVTPRFSAEGALGSRAMVLFDKAQRGADDMTEWSNQPATDDSKVLYLKSLSSAADAFHRIGDKPAVTQSDVLVLGFIGADFDIKKADAAHGFQMVHVHTRPMKDGVEQKGYQVWWAFPADADVDSSYTKVAQDSIDAYADLIPGVYTMYTKKGSRRGDKTPIRIQASTLQVDLPVPE
jgi:hypothetical protein